MKTLTKILSVAAVLANFANAAEVNLTKNLNVSVERGLLDKQEVNVVSVSKSFNYLTVKADLSNKTYKNYSVSFTVDNFKVGNSGKISISGIYGYEIFNGRTTETVTEEVQTTDQNGEPTITETTTTTTKDTKRHQIYAGVAGTYIVNKNLTLYNEIDVGTKAATLKLGLQHYFTNHLSVGAEISKRWSYNSDYDNTNNVLFNISYSF